MYIEKVSVQNFGPFPKADFEFSQHKVNVVWGNNGSGKSQLCGAILAAIVGRPALQFSKGGIGPSRIVLALNDENSAEETTLEVSCDADAKVNVLHRRKPLVIKILATMSDPYGPRLVLTDNSDPRGLTKQDLEMAEQYLPDSVRRDVQWSRLVNQAFTEEVGARSETALVRIVREFVARIKSKSTLPLIIDEFALHCHARINDLAFEILGAVAERSQVIVFSNQIDLPPECTAIEVAQPIAKVMSLTGYNNRLFDPIKPSNARRERFQWIKGAKFPHQENRSCELKEIKGGNPLGSIKGIVDQYAVAFMNAGMLQEGSVFWGVRDEDLVITGVRLTPRDCDELRRVVTEKLHQIVPAIAPTAYQVELHPISDGTGTIDGLYVVEVRVPAVQQTLLFATGSQDVYIKTDAGKRKLSSVEIQHELLRRVGVDPAS